MQTRREALRTIFGTTFGAVIGGTLANANELGKPKVRTHNSDGTLTHKELERQGFIEREGFDPEELKGQKDSPIGTGIFAGGTLAFLALKAMKNIIED